MLGFSPGFAFTSERRGRPPVFLSHGASDPVLPVSFTRELATVLQEKGYRVVYHEFEGGHALPSAVARVGFRWFVEPASRKTGGEARGKPLRAFPVRTLPGTPIASERNILFMNDLPFSLITGAT